MAEPIRLGAYAKIRGVSDEAVRQAVKTGRLEHCVVMVKGKPWIGDVALANREWELNTSAKMRPKGTGGAFVEPTGEPMSLGSLITAPGRAAFNRQQKAAVDPELPADYDPNAIDPATGVPRVAVSRARREHFDAQTAQLKAEEMDGRLVDAEATRRATFAQARELRDRCFLIPERLSDELAAMTDANEVSARLNRELRDIFEKMSETLEREDEAA